MKKRIAIIGRGTAGSQAIAHFSKFMGDCEIDWYYDPNILPQSVGEGASLPLSKNLYYNLNFNYIDMTKIDSSIKLGIYKSGWGKNCEDFLHQFPPPQCAFHFNAVALQNYVYDIFKDKVNIFEKNVSPDEIDADYIMDCSGKPFSYEDFNESEYIPVNSAYITQCYWDNPRFNYTLTIARPYGWVFGIPLKNRCSIGYLFNNKINDIEEVKKDVCEVFEEYNLIPSENVNSLNFRNYYRKNNYTDRCVHNGNSSFFLEPLEATSIANMDAIQRVAFDLWNGHATPEMANQKYLNDIKETETIIMMHYFAGSKYDTEFWKYAKDKGNKCIKTAMRNDSKFLSFVENAMALKMSCDAKHEGVEYGTWWIGSFYENIVGLGIKNKMKKLIA